MYRFCFAFAAAIATTSAAARGSSCATPEPRGSGSAELASFGCQGDSSAPTVFEASDTIKKQSDSADAPRSLRVKLRNRALYEVPHENLPTYENSGVQTSAAAEIETQSSDTADTNTGVPSENHFAAAVLREAAEVFSFSESESRDSPDSVETAEAALESTGRDLPRSQGNAGTAFEKPAVQRPLDDQVKNLSVTNRPLDVGAAGSTIAGENPDALDGWRRETGEGLEPIRLFEAAEGPDAGQALASSAPNGEALAGGPLSDLPLAGAAEDEGTEKSLLSKLPAALRGRFATMQPPTTLAAAELLPRAPPHYVMRQCELGDLRPLRDAIARGCRSESEALAALSGQEMNLLTSFEKGCRNLFYFADSDQTTVQSGNLYERLWYASLDVEALLREFRWRPLCGGESDWAAPAAPLPSPSTYRRRGDPAYDLDEESASGFSSGENNEYLRPGRFDRRGGIPPFSPWTPQYEPGQEARETALNIGELDYPYGVAPPPPPPLAYGGGRFAPASGAGGFGRWPRQFGTARAGNSVGLRRHYPDSSEQGSSDNNLISAAVAADDQLEAESGAAVLNNYPAITHQTAAVAIGLLLLILVFSIFMGVSSLVVGAWKTQQNRKRVTRLARNAVAATAAAASATTPPPFLRSGSPRAAARLTPQSERSLFAPAAASAATQPPNTSAGSVHSGLPAGASSPPSRHAGSGSSGFRLYNGNAEPFAAASVLRDGESTHRSDLTTTNGRE